MNDKQTKFWRILWIVEDICITQEITKLSTLLLVNVKIKTIIIKNIIILFLPFSEVSNYLNGEMNSNRQYFFQ